MHLAPVINTLRSSLVDQTALAGDDDALATAVEHLVAVLEPAVRQAALDIVQQAAAEVDAQLTDRTVEVVLADGDPQLRVVDQGDGPRPTEEFDARITLRLPPSLKQLIEDSAGLDGESVNTWVVDALSRRTKGGRGRSGNRVTESFDL